MRLVSVQTAEHLSWLSNLFIPPGAITYQSSKPVIRFSTYTCHHLHTWQDHNSFWSLKKKKDIVWLARPTSRISVKSWLTHTSTTVVPSLPGSLWRPGMWPAADLPGLHWASHCAEVSYPQAQLGFTSSLASSSSAGLSGYRDFGSAKPSWFQLEPCFIISDLSLPCLPVAMFSFHMSLSVIHYI